MTSEFVFFSSNPSLNHIKIEKCLLLFVTNTNIFTLLFKELKTDSKSFIFAIGHLTYNHQLNLSISARSWKIWKSHSRLDPILDMRKVVYVRSNEFLRMQNDRLPSGRTLCILCEKGIFFLSITLRVTRKVTKTSLVEFYRSHLH